MEHSVIGACAAAGKASLAFSEAARFPYLSSAGPWAEMAVNCGSR